MQAHPRCHFRPHESCLLRPSCASCPKKAATRIPSTCARVLLSYPWLNARILLTQPGPPLPSSQASRRSVFDLSSACQTSAFGRRIEPWGPTESPWRRILSSCAWYSRFCACVLCLMLVPRTEVNPMCVIEPACRSARAALSACCRCTFVSWCMILHQFPM